jgi:hypothetical protein
MIEVGGIRYGCAWDEYGHVKAWPLRVYLNALGEETTVEAMLEGQGHTYMTEQQLLALVSEMQKAPGTVELCGDPPTGVVTELMARGYNVRINPCPC